MPVLSRLRSLWQNVVHRGRVERDLDEELRALFDQLVDEHVACGMAVEDARRTARLQLGQLDSIKDQVRDVRAGALWHSLGQDVRYGTRVLLRHPLSTLTATLSLAICIGANTAVFSLVNRLLFRDPPGVAEPHRLVDIAPTAEGRFSEPFVHPTMLAELRERATGLEVFGHQLDVQPLSLRGDGGAERVFGAFVTMNYFSVLGVRPHVGRLFESSDREEVGASPIVVLSYPFWAGRFGADPAVIGQQVQINTQSLTVVGVATREFRGITPFALADLWLPASMSPVLKHQGSAPLAAAGRLRPGVSVPQAAAEVDALGAALTRDLPQARPPRPPGARDIRTIGLRVTSVSPLPPILRNIATGVLAFLMGLVGLVLAIACANVAGVLLARGAARRQEIAVRLAIGAGRGRLVRQLLTETVLLFVLGGAGGLMLAQLMTWLLAFALPPLPIPVDLSLPLDHRVFLFTAGLSFAAALLAGLLPAFQSSKADVVTALKSGTQGPSDRGRLRSAFVVAQVACSIVLVVAAGLLVSALERTSAIDTGFDATGVETTVLDLSLAGYDEKTGPVFVRQLVDRMRELPGVARGSAATSPPGSGQARICCGVTIPGTEPPDGEPFFQPYWNVVEPGYFDTLRIPILAGRDVTNDDRSGSERVTVISRAAADEFWPGQDAVGRHLLWEQVPRGFVPHMPILIGRDGLVPRDPVQLTVVGVVEDVKPANRRAQPVVYLPFSQRYQAEVSLVTRSVTGGRLAGEIRALVASMDPYLPVISATAVADQIGPVTFQLRLAAGVSSVVGLVGLLLAAIGIYGVTAYAVTRRTREIGIRVALGAQPGDVVRLVLGHGMVLIATGSAIGLTAAALAGRLLAHNRFGVASLDLPTFASAAVLLALVGLVACYVPVRRATRVNAMEALRYE